MESGLGPLSSPFLSAVTHPRQRAPISSVAPVYNIQQCLQNIQVVKDTVINHLMTFLRSHM